MRSNTEYEASVYTTALMTSLMNSSRSCTSAARHSVSTYPVSSGSASSRPVSSCQRPTAEKPLFRDQFEILKRLSRGGFSTTYLAKDVTGEQAQVCVIKQLRYRTKASKNNKPQTPASHALQLERNQRRFQKEARIMARIGQHSQLPRLLDHFVEQGHFYIVQEHIPGLTLQQALRREGPKTEAQIKDFLRDMIPVIRHVHRHNLLHLDIKPANIICRSSDQKLVLIDFGAVRQLPINGVATQAEGSTGTVGFAPSEQLAGKPTAASDIYSLGVTCLYLLTGCSPLDLATSPNGQDLRWRESVQVSDHLNGLLQKMLASEAQHRFQSVDELERAMDLETHYDALKPCMTREPMSSSAFKTPAACLLEDSGGNAGQSKVSQQASAIRRWQQRRRQFRSFTPR